MFGWKASGRFVDEVALETDLEEQEVSGFDPGGGCWEPGSSSRGRSGMQGDCFQSGCSAVHRAGAQKARGHLGRGWDAWAGVLTWRPRGTCVKAGSSQAAAGRQPERSG